MSPRFCEPGTEAAEAARAGAAAAGGSSQVRRPRLRPPGAPAVDAPSFPGPAAGVRGDRSGIVFYMNPLRAQAVLDGFLGEFGQTFTTLSVLHRFSRMRSTLPSDSQRNPMYFRDCRSRSTLILVLAHLLHQVRRITASCQVPTSSADITEPFSPGTAAQGRGSAWWCGKDGCGVLLACTGVEPSRALPCYHADPGRSGAFLVRKAQ